MFVVFLLCEERKQLILFEKTIAESGIIERVELFQFMCHQRLTFSFGPQINFIIGNSPFFSSTFFLTGFSRPQWKQVFFFYRVPLFDIELLV